MIRTTSKLGTIELPMTGGVNEVSRSNRTDPSQCLKMENFRLSEDGTRVVKRLGLSEDHSLGSDVYGFATYIDGSSNFCQLAVLEGSIQRKVGTGAWGSIHSFSSNIAHPVTPLQIQDKIFVINEVDSRMIQADGTDSAIGLVAPTTIPAIGLNYGTSLYTSTCDSLVGWTEADTGGGDVTESVNVPVGYNTFKFTTVNGVAGSATIYRTVAGGFGNRFYVKFKLYVDTIGTAGYLNIYFENANFRLSLYLDGYHKFRIYSSATNYTYINQNISYDTWYELEFYVDGTDSTTASADVIVNGVHIGKYDCSDTSGTPTNGKIFFGGYDDPPPMITTFYLDGVTVSSTAYNTTVAPLYRYAVTYAKSGNYGYESNPIKSWIETPLFYDLGGVNNMTVTGEYTGADPRTVQVKVTAVTPDKVDISYNNDGVYDIKDLPVTTEMYLSYGLTLNFAAITGHAVGSYWTFACNPISTHRAVGEQTYLNGLPISTDTQVDQRKIYRSTADGASFYWLATIDDNITTVFYDGIGDSALGALLQDDKDALPNGKLAVWWDNRLWVTGDNILYYSDIGVPEQFDIGVRYIDLHSGFFDDEITGIADFRDSLYIFKRHSTFIVIRKVDGTYGRFLIHRDIGCIAPWSLLEVNGLLMFLSFRGLELYNGESLVSMKFSSEVKNVLRTIDFTKVDFITSVHNRDYNEVWFSIPDRTGGESAITIVFNYLTGENWYYFSFYKVPSCLVQCRNSSEKMVIMMGTRDGYVCTCDTGYRDNTTNITATIRKPWITLPTHGIWRQLETEFEIPSGKTITANIYVDFDKDVVRTAGMTGVTLSATDDDLRRVIWDMIELGQRAKHLSVEYKNAENLGGDLKINYSSLSYAPREQKEKVYGD